MRPQLQLISVQVDMYSEHIATRDKQLHASNCMSQCRLPTSLHYVAVKPVGALS